MFALGLLLLAAAPAVAPSVGGPQGTQPGGRSIAVSASFTLRMLDGGRTDESAGTLTFYPEQSVCVRVARPLLQEMLLGREELLIYYPVEDLLLRSKIPSGTLPPMLDALLAGMVDPAATLPQQSKLVSQRREGDKLLSRWQLTDAKGNPAGELRAAEAKEGTTWIELTGPKGEKQRTYAFANRVRVRGASVPRLTVATYFDRQGKVTREEHWSLSDVAPPSTDGQQSASACARGGPKTKVREL